MQGTPLMTPNKNLHRFSLAVSGLNAKEEHNRRKNEANQPSKVNFKVMVKTEITHNIRHIKTLHFKYSDASLSRHKKPDYLQDYCNVCEHRITAKCLRGSHINLHCSGGQNHLLIQVTEHTFAI